VDTKSQRQYTRVVIPGLFLMLLCLATPSPAQEAAARVQFLVGDVSATSVDGKSRSLAKGDRVYPGDTIKTGDTGAAQLIYRDRSRMAVRVNTEFTIKAFEYSKENTSVAKSIFSLLGGALRMVTGLIGKTNPENVTIDTPIATIGIRGTDHEVVHISPEFQRRNPVVEVGTYNKVYVGATIMKTDRGNINLGLRQVGFVGGIKGKIMKPIQIKDMPKVISDQLINKIPVQAKIQPQKQPLAKSGTATSTDARQSTATRSIDSTTTTKTLDSTLTRSLDSTIKLDPENSLTIDRSIESGTVLEPTTTFSTTDALKSTTTFSTTDTLKSTTTISPTESLNSTFKLSPTQTLEPSIDTTTETLKSTTTISPTRTLDSTSTTKILP
jgi:hypothetical protein